MAENEIYRVEIPVIVDDQSEAPLSRASERVSRFEKEARKQNERIRKHFEQIAKMQIEPVMRIRDQLTDSVLKADRLVKQLGMEKAAPMLAVNDQISIVIKQINEAIDAITSGKHEISLAIKEDLLVQIKEVEKAAKKITGPYAELRGPMLKQIQRSQTMLEKLDMTKAEPLLKIRDQLSVRAEKAQDLVNKISLAKVSPVIAAQDRVSAVVTRINAILDALDKGKVDVFAELKGPLMDEIVKAKASLKVLEGVRAGPVAELRGELFGQLTKAMSQLKSLDKIEATPKATLRERVLSRAKEIGSVLWNLTSRAWTVVLQVKDNVTSTVRNIAGKIKNLAGKLTSPLGLLGAGAGAGAGIIFPLKLAGEMEQAGIAMEFFTGSVEKGQKFLERLQVFAAKTPFEFPDVREAAVGLLPLYKNMYGVDKAMDETIRTIRAFGDAAGLTGAGIQGMNLALLGFRQIGTMGKLGLEELRQVTENLLIPIDIILKELGLTGDALDDLSKKGIPAKKAMEAIVRALEKNFAGGMEKMSNSLLGLVSTLKDTARLTVSAFGAGMAVPVKRILMDITGMADYTGEKYRAFLRNLQDAGRKVGTYFEDLYQKTKGFWSELSRDPQFRMASFGKKIEIVLEPVLKNLANTIEEKTPVFAEAGAKWGAVLAKGIGKGIFNATRDDPMTAFILGITAGLITPGPIQLKASIAVGIIAAPWIERFIKWLIDTGEEIGKRVPGTAAYVRARVAEQKAMWDFFNPKSQADFRMLEEGRKSRLPVIQGTAITATKHAHGGIFSSPHIGMVAERGPEAIIPLSSAFRHRGLDLWMKVGQRFGINPVLSYPVSSRYESLQIREKTGRLVGIRQVADEDVVVPSVPVISGTGSVAVSTGPINLTINVTADEGKNVISVIRENVKEIAEELAEALTNDLRSAFQNMPIRRRF